MYIASEMGWIAFDNPIAQFPFILHLYKPGVYGTVYHLHVYFKVVTGESWLKEYILPLDDFLLNNRVKNDVYNLWVLNKSSQRYIFTLRHLLKGSSLVSRYLYKNDLRSYQAEFYSCFDSLDVESQQSPISLSNYFSYCNFSVNGIAPPQFLAATRFRWSLYPFLRIPIWTLSIERLTSFGFRFMNKVFYKKKKVFPSGGLVIAFTGVDGSGKSSMLDAMTDFFSTFLSVKQFQLGRPQGFFLETFRKLLGRANTNNMLRTDLTTNNSISLRKAIASVILSLLRLYAAKRSVRFAESGFLVFSDRWPIYEDGKMDGPRLLSHTLNKNFVIRLLSQVECWAYSRMPRADLCIILNVSLDTALNRNRNRIKQGKESDLDICNRYESNQVISPLANKIIRLNNDGDYLSMRESIKEIIWKEMIIH